MPASPLAIASIGECMVELSASRAHRGLFERRYGGDTLNTAVYLARLLKGSAVGVRYVTRLGDDPLSRGMIAGWQGEGIDCSLVEIVPGRLPGLYMIDTDERGERSFTYWRGEAPVRDLFARADDPLIAKLAGIGALYTSGVTLAVLREPGRAALIALMKNCKEAGATVAFDTNFRSRLWPDAQGARPWFEQAIAASTICLPSLDDLNSIVGENLTPPQWIERMAALGSGEIVLKTGGASVWMWDRGASEAIALPRFDNPVDTTGAGDSFNAGYLASRLKGAEVKTSIAAAHALAGRVVQFPGAIIPRDAMP